MKQNTTFIVVVAIVVVLIGAIMMGMTYQNNTDDISNTSSSQSSRYTLDDLGVSYAVNDKDKELYDIRVVGVLKSDADSGNMDMVQISGKACNNQNGSFPIVDTTSSKTGTVLVELEDGRFVLESPVVSTMMACVDTEDPQFDDGALTQIITDVAKSIQSL